MLKLPEGVRNVPGRTASKSRATGIFDSSKEKVLDDLAVSIREAEGRYHSDNQGAASKDNPVLSARFDEYKHGAYNSMCWKVQITEGKPKVDADGEELLLVNIKCKGARIPGLLQDSEGETKLELTIRGCDLVETLKGYKEALSAMDKDSELGQYWHNFAVNQSFPPKEKNNRSNWAHCLEQDKWVKKGDVKQASPYPKAS
ncbi:MAG: hypothetical protein CBC24_03975 [Candidatus Pelagibacter sp. TMED64]|nr:MAG: hypothetical protein CBC24_03975 [Candidatus Pelagibacter sp. TMED64]